MSFRVFLASLFVSKLADQILLFLVPLVVFQATQSVAWSGLAFAVEALPRFLSFPVCGALCDRRSPLKLLQWSQLLRAAVCVAGVLGNEWAGGVGWLVALSAVCGVLTTQGMMAREVLLPQIAAQGEAVRFDRVLALSQAADQTGFVLGPLLAAALLELWPWQGVVGAAAALFLLADATTVWWRRIAHLRLRDPEAGGGPLLRPIVVAFAHVWRLPGLKRLVLLAAGVNLIIGVTLASSAALVTGFYQRSTGDYAVLQTMGAVATIVILLTIARFAFAQRTLGVVSYTLIFLGGVLTGLGVHPAVYALGFLLVIGFDKMFNVYIRSRRQKIIPPADYGKTTGVIVMLNNLTQPLAGVLVGAFAGAGETGVLILVLSLAMGVLGLLAARSA
ncbi:MFS transporter [Variovorax sp. J22G21]|uniref:MFS transporter n=1 Tax=Variovorax fucosicus TaxID=3053517 RepID=UPI002578D021|nr:MULTISPECIES: MFS transporter [unclassified Variovorax]MDM0041136.1 MFS transporter [Variovorax sp. J22R193]MDM0060193.1 MFS transporter [Variovorax sp. J22G21]